MLNHFEILIRYKRVIFLLKSAKIEFYHKNKLFPVQQKKLLIREF